MIKVTQLCTRMEEIERELRGKMVDWQKKKDEEFKQKEAGFAQQLQLKEQEAQLLLETEKKKFGG